MKELSTTDLAPAEGLALERAVAVRKNAMSSGIQIGAAVWTSEGSVFTGVNVEDGGRRASVCADSSAVCAAAAGGSPDTMQGIVIVSESRSVSGEMPAVPCGTCRQLFDAAALRSGVEGNFRVITVLLDEEERVARVVLYTLEELLPYPYRRV